MSKQRVYEVRDIVGRKEEEDGRVYYKIRWKGYPSSADSWEPKSNLQNCDDLIKDYESSTKVAGALVSSDDSAPDTPVRQTITTRSTTSSRRSIVRRSLRTATRMVPETPVTTSTPKSRDTRTLSEPRYNLRKRTPLTTYLATFSSDEESADTKKKPKLTRKQLHTPPKPVLPPRVVPSQCLPPVSLQPVSPSEDRVTEVSVPPKQSVRVKPAAATPPGWMQLGYAEFFLALLLAAMIISMVWYYCTYYTPTE